MPSLIQIVYISRSTFVPDQATNGIEPNVARILMKSRTNNKNKGLVGVLYFGDGCFFQCLEGEEAVVDTLYETLLKDTRHKDLKIISRKKIDHLSFSNWAMKYVPLEAKMSKLLKSKGYESFNPYVFDAEMNAQVLDLLYATDDTATAKTESIVEKSGANSDVTNNTNESVLAKYAFALSIISFCISIYTLLTTLK